jgi:hypothetical protein
MISLGKWIPGPVTELLCSTWDDNNGVAAVFS